MAKKAAQCLAKAPLAEVVFELRWRLPGGDSVPAALRTDPGMLPLLEGFSDRLSRMGFASVTNISPPQQTAAFSITRRFKKNSDDHFPVFQIGVGILAMNEGPSYE